jgi:hypothetical protein
LAIKLKNKGDRRKDDYSKLKRKIFLQMFLIVFAAAAIVIFLRFAIQESFSFSDVTFFF